MDTPTTPEKATPSKPSREGGQNWRWLWTALAVAAVLVIVVPALIPHSNAKSLSYSQFLNDANGHKVKSATFDNTSGAISGELKDGTKYTSMGFNPPLQSDINRVRHDGVTVNVVTPSNALATWLPYIFFIAIMVGMMVFVGRQAKGQMNGIMSVGRSKAKLFSTDRPATTFADVAGYQGVKQEISEVVDFLKSPGRFKEIGATIPKGILLVGPPGTGKTLLARAVAGEAGVPFLSVSGSDFMEMFVGVGASRVRDLFQTARKQAPAIIFVDEIDSIGRKRGTGLGGGHDEREQTLNQMLSEMDGFDPTEGIVVMAATNRPDILDAAILRPGRFDRQIVVPLPDLDERLPILQVHCKDKKVDPTVDLGKVARGTPGMSGADLANLVNEAALHAVRRGSQVIQNEDFEASRDRVLMGQRRESLVLSGAEKERVAFHEGGHAVLAYVLADADPVHKVTILPTGMALGVTMQLPMEEKHIHPRQYIEDSLAVRMGGRAAELLVYGDLSTGASNDLVGNTELARRMVREWGMSDKIGPMAWGSQGQVFLGEDLMHTRDYSEHTSQVIDDEVELILRAQEERALDVLGRHRGGLDAVARALLDEETIDGETVGRLVDTAYGRPVHAAGVKTVPPIFVASQYGPTGSDDADGPPSDSSLVASDSGSPVPVPSASSAGDAPAPAAEPAGSVANAADAGAGQTDNPAPGSAPGNGSLPPAGHWPPTSTGWQAKQSPWPPPPPPAAR